MQKTHFFQVDRNLGAQISHLVGQQRQRAFVAFGKLPHPLGERLADAVHFTVDGRGNGGQPFVLDDQRFDVGLVELRVLSVGQRIEFGLGVLERFLEVNFLRIKF